MVTEAEKRERRWRVIEAAVAILEAAPDQALEVTKLNKAMFYLDLCHLRDHGETATRATYLALEHGPVMAKYPGKLIRPLEDEGLAEQTEDGMSKPVQLLKSLERYTYLSEVAREQAAKIARIIAKRTAKDVSRMSHRNPGWVTAYDAGLGDGGSPKPIDLLLALQQVGDQDPWLDEAPNAGLLDDLAAADSGSAEPW